MRQRPARVEHGRLQLDDGATISVGTPAWYRWLASARSFAYVGVEGSFTARCAESGATRYWRAYRKIDGRVYSAYLGRSADIGAERLAVAAQRLAPERIGSVPRAPASVSEVGFTPLLHARLQPPPLRPERLIRERLFTPLRDESRRTVLVVGPPGSGKSTLVADWALADRRAVAWLTLDADDNDPHRWLAGVAMALSSLHPACTTRAHSLLDPAHPMPATTIVHMLAADLAAAAPADAQGRPAVLVLDEYQIVGNPQIHELVMLLIERRIPALRIVIVSRTPPPLALRRLQGRHELGEIGAAELAFTAAEAQQWLGTRLHAADDTVVQALMTRTEGWAAALELAAFALQHAPDQASIVGDALPGIAALVEEALSGLTPDVRRLLLSIAVLDQVCPELCAAVVGQRSAQRAARALHTLTRANLFVLPLDAEGRWFRLHRLVAEALLHQLRMRAPERERVLRRRAAVWYEREGFFAEAVRHALAAQEWVQAARLIERLAESLWHQGAMATLERWIQALPQSIVLHHPTLAVIQAWAVATQGDLRRAETLLNAIEQACLAGAEGGAELNAARGRALALRAKIARMRGDGAEARRLGRHVLALFAPQDESWRATALVDLAVATFLDDRPSEALGLFQTAARLAQRRHNHHTALMALFHQASTLLAMGRLNEAQSVAGRARSLATLWEAGELPVNTFADMIAALIAYERDDLHSADQAIAHGLACLHPSGHAILEGQFYLIQAIIAAGRGRLADTQAALAAAEGAYVRAGTFQEPQDGWRRQFLAAWRAYLLAACAEREPLRAWLDDPPAELQPPLASWIYRARWLAQARAYVAWLEPAAACRRLESLCDRAEQAGAVDLLVRLLALLTRAYALSGKQSAAEATLLRAIGIGAAEGYVRSILDEGDTLLPLLRAVVKQPGAPAYARVLLQRLQHRGAPAGEALRSVLTPRERQVAVLIGAGYANAAIAERLVMANGTVKWHVSNILSKLGLRRRTELVAQITALGLLPTDESVHRLA